MHSNHQHHMYDQVVQKHEHIIREGDVQAQCHPGHLIGRVFRDRMVLVLVYEGCHFVRVERYSCQNEA